jgi:hypothetical protein
MFILKRGSVIFLLFLLTSFGMTSCAQNIITPDNDAGEINMPYPISTQVYSNSTKDDSAYPISIPTESLENYYAEQLTIPEPDPEKGIVTGRLLLYSTEEPYLAPGIYLGKEITDQSTSDETLPSVVSISPGSDPIATQAQDGTFLFTEIDPGEYRIFLWSPMSLVLLKDIFTSSEIIVIVEPGEITDLGDIFIE